MLSTTTFAGQKKGLDFFQIIRGEGRRNDGVTEMPGVRLPSLEAEFGSKAGGKGSDRPRIINFLA